MCLSHRVASPAADIAATAETACPTEARAYCCSKTPCWLSRVAPQYSDGDDPLEQDPPDRCPAFQCERCGAHVGWCRGGTGDSDNDPTADFCDDCTADWHRWGVGEVIEDVYDGWEGYVAQVQVAGAAPDPCGRRIAITRHRPLLLVRFFGDDPGEELAALWPEEVHRLLPLRGYRSPFPFAPFED